MLGLMVSCMGIFHRVRITIFGMSLEVQNDICTLVTYIFLNVNKIYLRFALYCVALLIIILHYKTKWIIFMAILV